MDKHFAVTGFVMNPSHTKVLMVHHRKLGVWVIPGGHLETNELPEEGMAREVREETGIEINLDNSWLETLASGKEHELKTPYKIVAEYIPEKNEVDAHIHIDLIYVAIADDTAPLIGQEQEVSGVKWMTKEEVLESDTFNTVKSMAKTLMV